MSDVVGQRFCDLYIDSKVMAEAASVGRDVKAMGMARRIDRIVCGGRRAGTTCLAINQYGCCPVESMIRYEG